jgi:hypothetical protein
MPRFSILTAQEGGGACCVFRFPKDLEDVFSAAQGERLGADYPDGLRFHMAAEAPGLRVLDVIDNALTYLMVTEKVKTLLERHATAEIEHLRFTLVNHKGRVASDRCYIVNVIGTLDAMDRYQSRGVDHPILQGQLVELHRLVLHEDRIGPETNLFRLATFPAAILIRDDLRAILDREGVTGAAYLEQGQDIRL